MKEEKKGKGVCRRDFIKIAGAGGIAAGSLGPAFLFPERAAAQQKTLKILQWSHFVPAYDTWFDGTFAKQWGEKHNTNVVVDHINLVDLNTRAASEAQAKKGHDLFMFLSPPAAYENQVIDMTHVYQEVEKKHGKKIDLAHKSTFNPKTKKYYAFSDSYAPDPGNWRKDRANRLASPTAQTPMTICVRAPRRSKINSAIPAASGTLTGTRHQHGDARSAMVVWRRGAG